MNRRRPGYIRPKLSESYRARIIRRLIAEALAVLSLAALFALVPIAWLAR